MSVLATSRLLLRPWREADLAPFAELNADVDVMRYFPARLSRHESDAMAERISGVLDAQGWGLWAVERRDEGRFIGFTGLSVPRAELPFMPAVEIGWRLARSAWGSGFAIEAAREALTFGFQQLGLREIVSMTSIPNQRSQAVMRRLGMVRDARDDFEHPACPLGHPLRAHVLYRLGGDAWRGAEPRDPMGEAAPASAPT